jgi:hypothetical protein
MVEENSPLELCCQPKGKTQIPQKSRQQDSMLEIDI